MALSRPPGLLPDEVGFLCEMELVTVIPRQRLESLQLLGGPTEALNPPFPARLPLWLALLLKRQKRANISPPPWMSVDALAAILDFEMDTRAGGVFSPAPEIPKPIGVSMPDDAYLRQDSLETSPPFMKDSCTTQAQPNALPYHWLELSHLLLLHAADDFDDPETVRSLLRDLREVRMSKLRKGFRVLDAGAGVKMNGVGAMEISEVRGLVSGVVDGLRRINRSKEEAQKDRAAEGGDGFDEGSYQDDDDDDDMGL